MNPTPPPTTVRLTAKQKERIQKLRLRYGTDQSKVVSNAIDYWFEVFAKASEEQRMKMILRPKKASAP